ncbi:MAG: sigma-70 family RNA polymerase sigma factor [Pseudomonadales bacterium]
MPETGDRRASALEPVLRAALPRVRGRLIGQIGDFDRAEDALQDALEAAWRHWPRDGMPERPEAWLYRVAQRAALDELRHASVVERHARDTESRAEDGAADKGDDRLGEAAFDDDLLRLVFACCHPVLSAEARAALTLRIVLDLSVEQVARAFLVEPRTLEQRLTRAKRRLRNADIEWAVPSGDALDARLQDVLRVLYLIFTEGYAASSGPALLRPELCRLAIGLARSLARLLRGRAETLALLALMLLHDSRAAARLDADGALVLLEDQDRSRWSRSRIAEGRLLLAKALALHQPPGPYQIQAAIAALHAEAASYRATDWPQIALLYDTLLRYGDTPVVRLNRAVAIGNARGAAAGIRELERLRDVPSLAAHHPYHLARAHLLHRLGQGEAARASLQRALQLVGNDPERASIQHRLDALAD